MREHVTISAQREDIDSSQLYNIVGAKINVIDPAIKSLAGRKARGMWTKKEKPPW